MQPVSFLVSSLMMTASLRLMTIATIGLWLVLGSLQPVQGQEPTDHYSELKRVLQTHCFACHGGLKQEAGLRLDTGQFLLESGAVESGQPEQSALMERVATDDLDIRMPPEHEGEPLNDAELEVVRRWILLGAPIPENEQPEAGPEQHWAFQPVTRPQLPEAADSGLNHPIDLFLAETQARMGVQPQPPATRMLQIRRLYIDLLGVLPTSKEMERWIEDPADDWYLKMVDTLLSDQRYGQRWGRHWMDIWRYSDWWGLGDQHRNSQKHIWHWRDWIVDSLNQDLAYDEMVRQMLAADELYPTDPDRLRATGFLARNWFLFNRNQWMDETIEHVSKSLLGITMNCAKCHDHKYDPISQVDYYRMRAIFEPYEVRLDRIPGEPDLTKDAISRVYDGWLARPTSFFVRGEEGNIDPNKVIQPGMPSLLGPEPFSPETVSLPEVAWNPGRRSWLIEETIKESAARLQKAESELKELEARVSELEERSAELVQTKANLGVQPKKLVRDDFEVWNDQLWTRTQGEWEIANDRLHRVPDGQQRGVVSLNAEQPRDFLAELEVKILGGPMWRSAGISFDVQAADDQVVSEVNVYISAVAGGAKLQAAYFDQGQWHYPSGNAVKPMPIQLGRSYRLRLVVRDSVINVLLDGEQHLSWRLPLERHAGEIRLTAFDAEVEFDSFRLRELGPNDRMIAPAGEPPLAPATLAELREQQLLSEWELAYRQAAIVCQAAEHHYWQRTHEAVVAEESEVSLDERQRLIRVALRARRQWESDRSFKDWKDQEWKSAVAESQRTTFDPATVKEAESEFLKRQDFVASPISLDESLVFPVAAQWSPTRFLDSGKDDPVVPFPTRSSGRRTSLAGWITSSENPLFARVAVNHLWNRHLGRPLVASVFDFGRNGDNPTHPELLDWLAAEFVDCGHEMKHMHRLIVTSQLYRRQSSIAGNVQAQAKDPENLSWWRREAIRIESQVVRDNLLSVSGNLDCRMGGPPVPRDQQLGSRRRSLYFFHSNNEQNLFLGKFDEALVTACYRRQQSIVPQQALALFNSDLVWNEIPEITACLSESSADDSEFVENAFQQLLGFAPGVEEIQQALTAIEEWRKEAPGNTAREYLIWVLINHNDFVTLR